MKRAVATIVAVALLALGLLLAPGELASTVSAKPAVGAASVSVAPSPRQLQDADLGCTVWCIDGRGMSGEARGDPAVSDGLRQVGCLGGRAGSAPG